MRKYIASLMIMLLSTVSLRADTVLTTRAESIRSVKVVAFNRGKLELIDRQGSRELIDYSEIALIRVNGQVRLNRAERLLMQKQFEKSAGEYQKVVNNISSKKSWITVWSKVRLMNILARLGRVRRMAELYIELANTIPDWVISVAPTRREAKIDKKQLRQIARILIVARSKSESTKVREAIAKFYKRLGCQEKLPAEQKKGLIKSIERNIEKLDQPGPWLDKWAEKKLKDGKLVEIYKVTDRLFKTSFRRNLPAVLYWQGRTLLADEKYDEAGLKLIRVAIEFPSSRYTPAAMFYAGRAAELAGKIKYARRIWKELIDNYSASSDFNIINFVEKARDALEDRE